MANIFISYSHKYEEWKERVVEQLAVLEMEQYCQLWDDRKIEEGEDWEKDIEDALNSADVAILLITAPFLTSKYIRGKEVPRILERREKEGLKVFPVIVLPCLWEAVKWLKKMQLFPKDGKPLSGGTEFDVASNLKSLASKVLKVLEEKKDKKVTVRECETESGKAILLTELPKRKIDLLGREHELKYIKDKLALSERVLVVNGIGGIGKTEVCKRFFMDRYCDYNYAAWVDYTGSLKESLTDAFNSPVIGGQDTDTTDQRFERISNFLKHVKGEMLLVLDNISEDMAGDEDLELFFSLTKNVHVLATSRLKIDGFEIYPLDVLPEKECMELFYKFHAPEGNRDDESVKAVIELCGRHTLTVELLARTANTGMMSAKKLLAVLKEKGFNLSEAIPEPVGSFYGKEKKQKLFLEHMQTVFDLSHMEEKEKNILANISVLPSIYIPGEYIAEWLGLETKEDINRLIDKGWLKLNPGNEFEIYMHPVIGEVVRQQTKPDTSTCIKLIESLTRKLYPEPIENPLDKKGFAVYGESVVRHIGDNTAELAYLTNNLSIIYLEMGQLDQALEFQLKTMEIWEKVLDKNHPDLAASYNNISTIYYAMFQLYPALEFQMKAVEIWKKVLDKDHPNLATSYSNASLIYKDMSQLDRAREFQLRDIEIKEKVLDKDHPMLATSYNNLSLIYQDMEQLDRALEFQMKAIKIREMVLVKDHPDLAQSYNNLSRIYQDMSQLNRALPFAERAVAIMENNFPNGHLNLDLYKENLSLLLKEIEEEKQKLGS